METKYIIADKENGEMIKEEGHLKMFETYKEADIWCQENGIDYDYWQIKEMII